MPETIPTWVGLLGTPAWVTDPAGNIGYLNERAEHLLGVSAALALGKPCHEVVAGRNSAGKLQCSSNCRVSARARRDLELEPFDLCVRGPNGGRHWAQVLIIAIQDPVHDRPWLVHCAIPRDESHRIEQYLSRVATRTGRPRPGCPARPQQELTRRENEVLQLLAEDHSLYAIADQLCISYVTVRNHVQHILTKLGVHSIIEAVARHLRHQEGTGT